MELVFVSKEHKASQNTVQQGLPPLLSEVLLFPLTPVEIPEKVELAKSYLCLTGLLWRTVIHFDIETRKEAFSSKTSVLNAC